MQFFDKVRRCALIAVVLAGASLGTAHATFPGENGDLVYAADNYILKFRPGAGTDTKILGPGCFPAVSPDSKKIAYQTTSGIVAGSRLQLMNIDGSNVVDIGPGMLPTWSPDGTKLAYFDAFPASGNAKGIYINPLNGQAPTLLAALDVNQNYNGPPWSRMSWSPTDAANTILLFGHDGGDLKHGQYLQYAVNASNGSITAYPADAAMPRDATWGPTGQQILAYFQQDFPHLPCIRLGSTPLRCAWGTMDSPTLSPDGSILAWIAGRANVNKQLQFQTLPGGAVQSIDVQEYLFGMDWARVPHVTMTQTFLNNGTWTPMAQMPADNYSLQTAVAVMPDEGAMGGTLKQMISINADGLVYHRMLRTNNTWTPFTVVPGIGGVASGFVAKRVAVAGAKDGSAQVVVAGSDDVVYHAMRYANGQWSGFNKLDGYNGAADFAARDVAIAISDSASNSPGYLQLAANGVVNGDVFHRVRYTNGTWSPFTWLGIAGTTRLAMAGAPNNGDAYILASTGQRVQRQMRHHEGFWDSWVSVAGAPTAIKDLSLSIGPTPNGGGQAAKVVYVAANGNVTYQQRVNPTQQSSWVNPTTTTPLMSNGRTVSVTSAPAGTVFYYVQAQPQ